MISFAELSSTWSNTVLCGYKYTYQIEVNCALKHLNNYFGARDCEKIKGLDVEKFLVFESEIVNPNTGKPFSKRVLNDHVDVGNTIYEFGLDNDIIPAIKLGMKTVWVRQGYAVYQSIDDESKRPDYIVDSIDELRELCGGVTENE